MCLFVNSLEGKVAAGFFELPPKFFSTWVEFSYWFKSTYGQPQSPTKKIKEYNNIVYNKGETIKSFNLCFTKLYDQIPDIIRPHNQAIFMHYYNTLLVAYIHRLEEKDVNSLEFALKTCLEFEEQLARTGLPTEDFLEQNDMSIVL
jgi:hypothetical protein